MANTNYQTQNSTSRPLEVPSDTPEEFAPIICGNITHPVSNTDGYFRNKWLQKIANFLAKDAD
ncbi:MAG: hypothetical protein VB032_06395 [Burkholderiaceae bacterium]|nr:hypothetical protein [Burkholderiaceae bacterium]